jgi:hypothetical protein
MHDQPQLLPWSCQIQAKTSGCEGQPRSFLPSRLSQSAWREGRPSKLPPVARRVGFGLAGTNAGDPRYGIAYGDELASLGLELVEVRRDGTQGEEGNAMKVGTR